MGELTLPGQIDGLVLPCSPVISPAGRAIFLHREAVDYSDKGPRDLVWVRRDDGTMFVRDYSPGLVALDLAKATGRAHASWYLIDTLNSQHRRQIPRHRTLHRDDRKGVWRIGKDGVACATMWWFEGDDFLSMLDPADPKTLPDGSKWVNAEALRLICLNVAMLGE